VTYVVPRRAVYKYTTQMIVRAANEERFHTSGKQIAELNKWPNLEPGNGGCIEDKDVTPEESSSDDLDEDY
jgi:hypothetical protein